MARRLRGTLRRLVLNTLVRVLFEPECVSCQSPLDRPLAGPVCESCWRAVPRLTPPCCVRCGDALPSSRTQASLLCARCRHQPPFLQMARSAGRYDGTLREIVHAFKYGGRRMLARPLAEMMRTHAVEVLLSADAAVPVPLHPWRAFRRGFNQADDLARLLGLPVWPMLRRRRNSPAQAALSASERRKNVERAFALRWTAAHRPAGRVLVLVDDVMTTGATLEACARVLLEAGADSVRAVTAARAVAGRPAPRPPPLRLSTVRR
jgi:ComF family protein